MISICFVSTFTTSMNSTEKLFLSRMCVALGAGLRRSIWIDTEEVDLMFQRLPFQQVEKLTKSGIKGVFSQHPSRHRDHVQVLNKYHPDTFLGTQMVSQLQLPIFPNTSDVVVESGNTDTSFLAVFRTLQSSGILALQQFKLAVQGCQESGSSNELSIRGCQEFLQSQINTQRIAVRLSVWYRYIRLYCYHHFPPIRFSQHPRLFDHKSFWNGSMQVDGHLSNLGKSVLLSVIGRKWLVGWNDVFSLQRTIIQTTFTRIYPLFDFPQSVVVHLTRNLQPMQHCLLLCGIGINSVAVVHNQSHKTDFNTEL